MKFKAFDPTGRFTMSAVYQPKNKKHAESLMKLHRDMGDGIEILEEGDYDETE